jgi:hypothetical protein
LAKRSDVGKPIIPCDVHGFLRTPRKSDPVWRAQEGKYDIAHDLPLRSSRQCWPVALVLNGGGGFFLPGSCHSPIFGRFLGIAAPFLLGTTLQCRVQTYQDSRQPIHSSGITGTKGHHCYPLCSPRSHSKLAGALVDSMACGIPPFAMSVEIATHFFGLLGSTLVLDCHRASSSVQRHAATSSMVLFSPSYFQHIIC